MDVGIDDQVHTPAAIENHVMEVANDDRDAEEAAIENGTHLVELAIENHILMETYPVDSNMVPFSPMIIPPSHFGPGDAMIAKFQCGSKSKQYVGQVLTVDVSEFQIKFLRNRRKKVLYFPDEDDISWHAHDAYLLCIEQPLCNNKGQLVFNTEPLI